MLKIGCVLLACCGFFISGAVAGEAAKPSGVTIWLAGDSTVASYPEKTRPQAGWGQSLQLFCKDGVKVENRAVGGRSTKSFVDEKRWEKVLAGLKKGDFVLIQFGHNDQKKDKPEVYAEANSAYKENLKQYVAQVREKGATPVLVTSVCRRIFKDGTLRHSLGDYPAAMRAVAASEKVELIDLNQISFDWFSQLGDEGTQKVFNYLEAGKWPGFPKGSKDNSHFNEYGAVELARRIVQDAIKQKLPLAENFIATPEAVKNEF